MVWPCDMLWHSREPQRKFHANSGKSQSNCLKWRIKKKDNTQMSKRSERKTNKCFQVRTTFHVLCMYICASVTINKSWWWWWICGIVRKCLTLPGDRASEVICISLHAIQFRLIYFLFISTLFSILTHAISCLSHLIIKVRFVSRSFGRVDTRQM